MSATATQAKAERAELEAILSSGIFSRSPSLATFLRFICERYLEGNTDGLKEYCIAVEALKRPPDFDQKKDAIVRVEAHRLRKRLADYYQNEGADHPIHIEIPNGQYGPRFVYKQDEGGKRPAVNPAPKMVSSPEAENSPAADAARPRTVRNFKTRLWITGIGFLVVAICALVFWHGKRTAARQGEVWHGRMPSAIPIDFRMLAGYHGPPFTDRQGRTWFPDAYYNGGISVPLPDHRSYQGLPDPDFAASQRVGDFEYNIPAAAGSYEIHFYFVEAQADDAEGPGAKLFNVLVNGKVALDHIDPLSDAGAPKRLSSRVLNDVSPGEDGLIHLKFEQQGTPPNLVGLEILATPIGKIRPVRIVAAAHSVIDSAGNSWMADEYSVGGTLVDRKNIVADESLKSLYSGERFGNFAYHIPLPPGKYRVTLYFDEAYFTDTLPNARIFNVFADGVTLLRNFNVMKEAGGPRRALIKTFENLEPNAQGKIVLEFVPVANYAEINAIEVTRMN